MIASAFDWISSFTTFFTGVEIGGLTMIQWSIFVLVLVVSAYLIKGNH